MIAIMIILTMVRMVIMLHACGACDSRGRPHRRQRGKGWRVIYIYIYRERERDRIDS